MRVHVVALRSGLDGPANTALAVGAVTAAAADGADLVVLPEYTSRFDPSGVGPEHAEPLDEGFVPALRAVARTGVAVIAGTVIAGGQTSGPNGPPGPAGPESPNGPPGSARVRAVNAVVAIDATGELVGVYRKVHLYDAFGHRESDRVEPGTADAPPLLIEVAGMVVGVLTCYDLRFPESARRLADAGAQVLAVPAAWASGERKADHWLTLLRARAIENTAYVLGAAQQGLGVVGDSVVIDPEGVVLARACGGPDAAVPGGGPELVAEDGRPEVAAEDGRPEVAVRDGRPEVAVRDGRPEVAVRDGRPEVAVRDGRPEVAVAPRATVEGARAAVAELRGDVVAAVRERNPSLANRRYAVVPVAVVPVASEPHASVEGRVLWDRCLMIAWVLALVLGLALVVAAGSMVTVFDALFFPAGGAPIGAGPGRDYLEFVHQVLGAVLVGWAALLAAVAAGPLRRRERWAWWAATISVGSWYLLDTTCSLAAGFVANALLNSGLAVLFAVSLVGMRRELMPRRAA